MKLRFSSLIFLSFFILAACEDDKETTPTETAVSIPEISVACSTGDATACQAANTNTDVMFIWTTSACSDIDGDTVLYAQTGLDVYNLACTGADCAAETNSTVPFWMDGEGETVTVMPSSATTALAWINFGDSGVNDEDGPGGGDVLCCLEDQTSDAEIPSSACTQL